MVKPSPQPRRERGPDSALAGVAHRLAGGLELLEFEGELLTLGGELLLLLVPAADVGGGVAGGEVILQLTDLGEDFLKLEARLGELLPHHGDLLTQLGHVIGGAGGGGGEEDDKGEGEGEMGGCFFHRVVDARRKRRR